MARRVKARTFLVSNEEKIALAVICKKYSISPGTYLRFCILDEHPRAAQAFTLKEKIAYTATLCDDTPVEQLELTVRLQNILRKSGFKTFGQIIALSVDDFVKIKGVGKVLMEEFVDLLANPSRFFFMS